MRQGDITMFRDRRDAGIQLAQRLIDYRNTEGVLILALPRGGVVTGFEIARYLNAPLDVLIVRKIGAPLQPELAVGAISETGTVVLNQYVVTEYGIPESYIDRAISLVKEEISRRVSLYRMGKGIKDLEGKTIILVDDGVATGATMKAAITTLKREKLTKLVAALPVAPPDVADEIKGMVDELVCIDTPPYFMAVGNYYLDFSQVSDQEVVEILKKSMVEDRGKSIC